MPRKPQPSIWRSGNTWPFGGDLGERYPPDVIDALVAAAALTAGADAVAFRTELFEILREYEFERYLANRPTKTAQRAALANIEAAVKVILDGFSRLDDMLASIDDDTRQLLNMVAGEPASDALARSMGFAFSPDRVDREHASVSRAREQLAHVARQLSFAQKSFAPPSRGRPPRRPEYEIVKRLAGLYHHFTGRRPTRVNAPEGPAKPQHFQTWAAEVLQPFGVAVSDAMVKEAIAAAKV